MGLSTHVSVPHSTDISSASLHDVSALTSVYGAPPTQAVGGDAAATAAAAPEDAAGTRVVVGVGLKARTRGVLGEGTGAVVGDGAEAGAIWREAPAGEAAAVVDAGVATGVRLAAAAPTTEACTVSGRDLMAARRTTTVRSNVAGWGSDTGGCTTACCPCHPDCVTLRADGDADTKGRLVELPLRERCERRSCGTDSGTGSPPGCCRLAGLLSPTLSSPDRSTSATPADVLLVDDEPGDEMAPGEQNWSPSLPQLGTSTWQQAVESVRGHGRVKCKV